jgi:hypothetical protein
MLIEAWSLCPSVYRDPLRCSLNLLITRCDWLETLMEYGFHGFFSARKICWCKNTRKALAHKGFGNFINRLSQRLGKSASPVRWAGCGNGVMGRLLGHRQTKGTETDKPNLMLPRHISTLPCCRSPSAQRIFQSKHNILGKGLRLSTENTVQDKLHYKDFYKLQQ